MPTQFPQEWPDQHIRTPYPFIDTARLVDTSNQVVIDPSWVVDARLWPTTDEGRVFLRTVIRSSDKLVLEINDLGGRVMSASVTDFTKERVVFRDDAGFQAGWIQFAPGALSHLHDVPSDTYRFALTATEFVATAVSPRVKSGIRSLSDSEGNTVEDDLRLVGGEGVELEVVDGELFIHLIGDAYYRRDVCGEPERLGLAINPVRKILWIDAKTGQAGIVAPTNGHITTRIVTAGRDRGFKSPSADGTILSMITG